MKLQKLSYYIVSMYLIIVTILQIITINFKNQFVIRLNGF